MSDQKPRRVALDCGHILWMRMRPNPHDVLWCLRCERYEPLLLSAAGTHAVVFDPEGEFKASRFGNLHKGECLYPKCAYTTTVATGYENLRNKLHTHYMREHTAYGSLEISVTDRLPKNSPPPF